jgi:hypothetical protein
MGTGFCVVVSPAQQQAAMDALRGAGEQPVLIGVVTDCPGRSVSLPTVGLTGRGEVFSPGGTTPPDPPDPGGTHPPRPPLDTV